MSKEKLATTISRGIHRVGFTFKKHSPEILLATGLVSGVACVISACKATRKLDSVLENKRKFEEEFTAYIEDYGYSEEYTEEDAKKDLALVNVKTGWELVKLYAPAVGFGAISIASILGSHNIINKRYLSAAAAYTATLGDFNDYRERLIERFCDTGKDLDRELRYNIKAEEVEEPVVHEDGTETVVKKTVKKVDLTELSDFSIVFTDGCKGFDPNFPEYNRQFLNHLQAHWNKVLQEDGYVFLNDIRRDFGLNRTQLGQVVGWVYDPKNPDLQNVIDFGLDRFDREDVVEFFNGNEASIIIDLRPDGEVYELMK